MENFLEKHETECAHQAKDLTSLIQSTVGKFIQEGLQTRQTLRLATLTMGTDYSDPFFRPLAGGLLYSSLGLARSAIQQGAEIVRHLYDTDRVGGSSTESAEGQLAALLAIDFSTDENGWPCTFEDPLINAVLLAPLSMSDSVGSASQAEALVLRFDVGPTPLRGIEWQETDCSEAGIRSAVDHLQRFIRTLPGAMFPEDARPSLCGRHRRGQVDCSPCRRVRRL